MMPDEWFSCSPHFDDASLSVNYSPISQSEYKVTDAAKINLLNEQGQVCVDTVLNVDWSFTFEKHWLVESLDQVKDCSEQLEAFNDSETQCKLTQLAQQITDTLDFDHEKSSFSWQMSI